jgi:predicted phage terminase large subunit-like protein
LLADKHARDCRQLMESAEYQALFPGTRLSATKNSVGEYETTRGGYRLSTSVGGTLTGRGGNLIILDDPQRPEDATSDTRRQALHRWYDHTLYSRLDNKMTDAIVLVMQRLHVEDLVGHVLLQEPWTQLSLPALAEADTEIPLGGGRVYHRAKGEPLHATRESPELLAQLRRTLGAAAFSAQYQQEPMPAEGALLQWGWFKTYQAPFRRRPGDVVILSWDTASLPGLEHDYSVGQTWIVRGTDFYLAHVHRGHWNYPELKARVFDQIRRLKPYEIIIEQANTGIALVDELRAASREGTIPLWLPRIRTLSPSTGKAARLAAESAVIESGCVWLPDEATWLEAFRQEVLQFPYGRYDDQMDAMSQFLFRMRTNIFQPPAPPDGPPEPELPPRRRLREGWPRSGLDFGR